VRPLNDPALTAIVGDANPGIIDDCGDDSDAADSTMEEKVEVVAAVPTEDGIWYDKGGFNMEGSGFVVPATAAAVVDAKALLIVGGNINADEKPQHIIAKNIKIFFHRILVMILVFVLESFCISVLLSENVEIELLLHRLFHSRFKT